MNNPCFIFGDNKSVLWNTTVPDSMLKKKTASVSYHFVRGGVSAVEWRTSFIHTGDNPADTLTKNLPAGENRYRNVRMFLYDIYIPRMVNLTRQTIEINFHDCLEGSIKCICGYIIYYRSYKVPQI